MTRIISGFAGSRELKVPREGTRPTSDRVREALFSSLDSLNAIRGSGVLDLYAGSGALGLEALSRGAAHVTLVERNPEAAKIITRNAKMVARSGGKDTGTFTVYAATVAAFVAQNRRKYGLVFVDPPYEVSNPELELMLAALSRQLTRDALIVVERSARDEVLTPPEGLEIKKLTTYGETNLIWLELANG